MTQKNSYPIACLFALFLVSSSVVFAQNEEPAKDTQIQKEVKVIEVTGNKAISTPTIMAKIKTRVGQPYYAQASRDDIKRLYETGFFSDITLSLVDHEGGLKVIFKVEERPVIEEIRIEGNRKVARGILTHKLKSKMGNI